MPDYTAIFCPNCGVHLNEVDEQDAPEPSEETTNFGTLYTCGWCKSQTRDWDHVKSCRRTWTARQAFRERQQVDEHDRLNRMAKKELSRLVAELENRD